MNNTTDTTPATIATMLEQLGGRRIFAMAFSGCVYSEGPIGGCPSISLEIARPLRKAARGATKVLIALEATDTYAIRLWKAPTAGESARGEFDGRTLAELSGVYADGLRRAVESLTGLALTL